MQEQTSEINTTRDPKMTQAILKIAEAENILIALSQNPTADELSAAIGLSLFLDKTGKHATAIYSGKTPSIIEFLEPEQRLETNTDSLRDFIIALNKNKADHLHYKVDGDYVKIYITPYKTKISEQDLEFSHGDFNIGLVVALNVPNANSLDQALSNHGRILHDAEIINIAAAAPGDFGNIQWSNPAASSVSEMVAELMFALSEELGSDVDGDVATAVLTGVFVATERFSNNRTQPETMNMAARLMSMGANQQLISEYMKKAENGGEVEKEDDKNESIEGEKTSEAQAENSENKLKIQNENTEKSGVDDAGQYVQAAHTESQPRPTEQPLQDTPSQEESRPILNEGENAQVADSNNRGDSYLASASSSPVNQRPVLKPLGSEGNSVGMKPEPIVGKPEPVHLAPIGTGLPSVNPSETIQTSDVGSRPSLEQMATPFEESPAPAFVGESSDSTQPISNSNATTDLSSLGVKSSVDESVMNELKNLPTDGSAEMSKTEPLGKDYNSIGVVDNGTVSGQGPLDSNPASAAAPGVNDALEENHIPGLDFSNPVSMADDEPNVGGDSGFLVGAAQTDNTQNPLVPDSMSSQTAEAVNPGAPSATLEPKPQGMPLPGEEILPPPPTPPIDFGTVKADDAALQPEPGISSTNIQAVPSTQVEPATLQNSAISQPEPVVNQGPGLPQVDQSILGNESIATPTSFQQPASMTPVAPSTPVTPVAPAVPSAPANDPSAFKIPGM